jgi:hypothetical protein
VAENSGDQPKPKQRGPGRPFQKTGPDGKADPRINKLGRPKTFLGFQKMLRKHGEKTALRTLKHEMKQGGAVGVKAAEVWLAYCRGKPAQPVELSGKNGGPIELNNLSDEQLQERYRKLIAKGTATATLPPEPGDGNEGEQ